MATKKGMINIVKKLLDRGADSSSKSKVKTRRYIYEEIILS